ncbi:MAG: GNAT family N-acetyltransferase [Gemmatimonadales bacterium]|nr:GNAT family N-acetyltransferase [Gemmatimonadales bacterium]NIN12456.1 GNAT family N-acetyltransferase [Gemmatimonadales bacterium]NIN50832.1 GNAT family N-acetyltransferase [Gemmatimonadales bacterium]NIP08296.1 GNAT family N-acetyltransferase [Gemmatimonadales bacterium]NIR00820.1 GNAT family N-acetyltransferase [Gemmatimonadales bacterium]
MPLITLTTPRLILRAPRLADADAIYNGYATDPEVARFVLWTPHESIEETRAFLIGFLDHGRGDTSYPWVITRAADRLVIGAIHLRVNAPKGEVGFNIDRAEWGRGYGTEALRAVIEFGLGLAGVHRIQALCHVENAASARVMEKAGMVKEGVLRRFLVFPNISAEPQDVFIYAQTRERT